MVSKRFSFNKIERLWWLTPILCATDLVIDSCISTTKFNIFSSSIGISAALDQMRVSWRSNNIFHRVDDVTDEKFFDQTFVYEETAPDTFVAQSGITVYTAVHEMHVFILAQVKSPIMGGSTIVNGVHNDGKLNFERRIATYCPLQAKKPTNNCTFLTFNVFLAFSPHCITCAHKFLYKNYCYIVLYVPLECLQWIRDHAVY